MTTPIPNVNNLTLTNLTPNLDIGDVADPALRLAAFQYIYTEMQTIITAHNAFVANGGIATANIAELAVTTGKIALLAVTAAQIANGTITTTQIADGTILDVDINTAAAIAWTKISKATSSLADLATRLASDLTGTLNATQLPAFTGDITTPAGSVATSLKATGSAGTYKSVTTDAQGRVTAGTNPTTRAGYGITDAAPLSHVGQGGSSQHPDATTSQSGFISAADLIAFRALTPTGLGSYAVPVGQIFSLWGRYSFEQDATTGELVIYEI